ncbi:MAG: ABC transporter permease [bacterium]|nr:ABC transporter permease [bacterium]
MWNPVFEKESKVSARSFKLALMMLLFNGILAIVALFNMYSVMEQVKMTAEVRYSSFLELYIFVAAIEFILILFLMPSITASGISGERERQTLDLMLTTRMTTGQIVIGKMMAAMQTMLLLMISSLPVLSLVFVYGGISGSDLAALLGYFAITALFVGSMGLCFSALCKKTMLASVLTYLAILILAVGTYSFNRFFFAVQSMNSSSLLYSVEEMTPQAGAGCYLLLLNPAVTFYLLIYRQAGSTETLETAISQFGRMPENFVTAHWVGVSVLLQAGVAVLLLWVAARAIEPGHRRGR